MSEKTASGGIGFTSLLQLAFIVLKLTKVIDWKWVWVLAPIWIPFSVAVTIIILVALLPIKAKKH